MALINCEECGQQISDRAPACPNCGWMNGFTELHGRELAPKVGWLKPGDFLRTTRLPHIAAIACYGGIGFLSMTDIELFIESVGWIGALVTLYFFILMMVRAFLLREASPDLRRQTLFDLFDILIFSVILTFISSFWMGFSQTAMSTSGDVTAIHTIMAVTFSSLAVTTAVILVGAGIATIADPAGADDELS